MYHTLHLVKSKKILIPFIILASFLFFFFSKPIVSKDMTEITPTLFVHGYKGGNGSFKTMMKRFEKKAWGSKRMVYHVSATGKLFVFGDIGEEENPFIQVIFENNRATIASQSVWLQQVMKDLYQTYSIQQVNLVGHSMGGLASTNFIVTNQGGILPHVEKLVVIGSPFLGIDNDDYFSKNYGEATTDLKAGSHALRAMMAQKSEFNSDTDVLAIAGVINDGFNSDGLVSLSSALGIRDYVLAEKYNQKIFYDPNATHSGLHEHKGVDQQIASFLWGY
ncbi:alpha/beta hydrolase [Aquibacillus albus]|uniref:Alpha/beta hydrolase family protein n=1 Tax=Aquibacillus albus TaxID=1168171 RepID=A0ABS2MZ90_9BACI|nr:alpha/beta hydrolase [Aquibacillus albus]MBM7571228.1 putative alpha/beta hydrolase family protein [Aquibacillus albus]